MYQISMYSPIVIINTLILLIMFVQRLESNYQDTNIPHRRFEYKYSFKGPYLAQKDGTVPFWEYSGNAIASEELVRITPSLHSKKGQLWSKLATTFEWWEVDLIFRVTGKGRIGADGLAFWFTDRKYPEGPVFGSSDHWNGLAIFFDSFDNDGKGNNPYIMAMINDGSKTYDHNSDGINQQLQGCLRDFRNKPYPVRAKIEYYRNVLSVMIHSGNTNNDDDYELCFRVENVFLPQYGHFVSMHNNNNNKSGNSQQQGPGLSEADKQRFNKEYEVYKEKLERQREEYLKAHPDEARKLELESDKAVDVDFDFSVKELRQIFDGQSEVYEHVKLMSRKLDEIIGRQERALSMISNIHAVGGIPQQQQQPGGVPQIQANMPISRPEVESLLGVHRELLQNSREIKVLVQHGQQQQQVPVQHNNQVGSQDSGNQQLALLQQLLNEIVFYWGGGGGQTGHASPQYQQQQQQTSCISTLSFISFLSIHLLMIIGALYYFSGRDAQSKKFY
ncbi:protein ergic-53-like protein [Dermatophagoides farinae]|uniref:Protein ergic-53-like protein n=1 Tax=Dermatophagoides farinae TaxID=6954 RepID=A0A9D4NVR6_DERFA|nr:protein ergic-53-like protein [Dermatophagoides farinae]